MAHINFLFPNVRALKGPHDIINARRFEDSSVVVQYVQHPGLDIIKGMEEMPSCMVTNPTTPVIFQNAKTYSTGLMNR